MSKENILTFGFYGYFYFIKSNKLNFIRFHDATHLYSVYEYNGDNNPKLLLLGNIINHKYEPIEKDKYYFEFYDWRRYDTDKLLRDIYQKSNFKLPKTYVSNDTDNLIRILDMDKMYYIKVKNTARQIGKLKCSGYEFLNILELVNKQITIEEFNPKLKIKGYLEDEKTFNKILNINVGNVRSENEKYALYRALSYGASKYYIQEAINFDYEYRLVMFKTGGFILEKREGYEYDAVVPKKHYVISFNELKREIGSKLANEIIDKAKEFINNLNLPTISLDVWVDLKNKKIGLFEWSTEYGLKYPKSTLKYLSKELTKSVEDILLR